MKLGERELGIGDRGEDVRLLHRILTLLGHAVDDAEHRDTVYGPRTRDLVARLADELGGSAPRGVLARSAAAALLARAAQLDFLVFGRVVDAGGKPAPGLRITAADRDVGGEQVLGEAVTDGEGVYQIRYRYAAFARAERGTADLVVRAYGGGDRTTPAARSPVQHNAAAEQRVDLRLPDGYVTRSELDGLLASVETRLGKHTPAQLTSADLELLTAETRQPTERLRALVEADRRAPDLHVRPAAVYALLRVAGVLAIEPVLARGASKIEALLDQALARRIVTADALGDTPGAIARVLSAGATERQRRGLLDGLSRRATVELGEDARRELLEVHEARGHDPQAAWAALAKSNAWAGATPRFQLDVVLAAITGGDGHLARAIAEALPEDERRPRGLATLSATALEGAVRAALAAGGQLPRDATSPDSADAGDRARRFAEDLGRAAQIAFPAVAAESSARVAPELDVGALRAILERHPGLDLRAPLPAELDLGGAEERTSALATIAAARREAQLYPSFDVRAAITAGTAIDNPVRSAVATFLGNSPDLDLGRDAVRRYAADHPQALAGVSEADSAAVIDHLESVQRLLRIVPEYQGAEELLASGYRSAAAVSTTSRGAFVRDMAPSLGLDRAVRVHQASQQVTALSTHLYMSIREGLDEVRPRALGGTDTRELLLTQRPDLPSLFGRADICACAHCRSVYSPAAYFVDLLLQLDRARPADGERSPGEVLRERRPDLPHIPLTCENSDTEIPYIDLVLEILEAHVAFGRLDPGRSHTTADVTAEELAAGPQHLQTVAYDQAHAGGAIYPPQLPFDRPVEIARAHLEHLGMSRAEIMDGLAVDMPGARAARAAEALGLYPLEHAIVADAVQPPRPLREYYGYTTEGFQALGLSAEYHANAALADGPRVARTEQAVAHRWGARAPDARLTGTPFSVRWSGQLVPAVTGDHRLYASTSGGVRVYLDDQLVIDDWAEHPARERASAARAMIAGHPQALVVEYRARPGEAEAELRWLPPGQQKSLIPSAALRVGADEPWRDHLARVTTFLERTSLDFEALRELLSTRFVNPPDLAAAERVVVQMGNDPCDLDAAVVVGLGAGGNRGLNRIHRFLRLWRALARTAAPLTIFELDAAIVALGGGVLDAPFLERLAQARRLAASLHTPLSRLLVWWASLDTRATRRIRGDGTVIGDVSPYDVLFQSTTLSRAVDPDLSIVGSEVADPTATLDAKRALLLAALGLSEPDLERIRGALTDPITHTSLAAPAATVSLARLSAITRFAIASRAFGLSVRALIEMMRLTGIDPFASPASALDFLDAVERVRGADVSVLDLSYVLAHHAEPGESHGAAPAALAVVAADIEESLAHIAEARDPPPARRERMREAVVARAAAFVDLDAGLTNYLVNDVMTAAAGAPATALDDLQAPQTPELHHVLRRLEKVASIMETLDLSRAEVAAFVASGDLDPNRLPVTSVDPPDPTRWASWSRMAAYAELRRVLPPGAEGASSLLDVMARARAGDPWATVVELLSEVTGWDRADLGVMLGPTGFDLAVPALGDPLQLQRVARVISMSRRVGVSAARLARWALDSPSEAQAQDIADTVEAKYERDIWLRVAPSISDRLRTRQRDALVALVLQQPALRARGILRPNQLFEYFLIDASMDPCFKTSRLRQAISSVQLFVQRCILNLEQEVDPTLIDTDEWKWKKNYRVWEANTKVFIYPENYLEPGLRDDKTPFFRELESALMQGELSPADVESTYLDYLRAVDGISRLQVVAFCRDGETVHVVARSANTPRLYYYRRRVDGEWGGWDRIPLEITGDHALLAVHHGRLYLFWATCAERPVEPEPAQLAQDAPPDSKKPTKRWEVVLAFSEHEGTRWAPKRTASRAPTVPLIDRRQLALRAVPDHLDRLDIELDQVWLEHYEFQYYSSRLAQWTLSSCSGELALEDRPTPREGWGARPARATIGYMSWEGHDDLALDSAIWSAGVVDRRPSEVVLASTPAPWRVVYDPATMSELRLGGPLPTFFFMDRDRSYFVEPRDRVERHWVADPDVPKVVTAMGKPDTLWLGPLEDSARRSADRPQSPLEAGGHWVEDVDSLFHFSAYYHPYVCSLIEALRRGGVPSALALTAQLQSDAADPVFQRSYDPTALVHPLLPLEEVDFAHGAPLAPYNWELFVHAPWMIADRLSAEQRFEEAQRWYHFLFDPTTRDPPPPTPRPPHQRFWRAKPLHEDQDEQRIVAMLTALADPSGDPALQRALREQIVEWRKAPFQPHRIARLRVLAYRKRIFMKYLDNLLAWGDSLFSRYTIESVNEATQLYVLAAELLGPRPQMIPRLAQPAARTYQQLVSQPGGLDELGNALVQLETLIAPGMPALPPPLDSTVDTNLVGLGRALYFCVPSNEELIHYWAHVEDRLDKLRHCKDIEGRARKLALYEPPIDPMALVRAAAGGGDFGAALAELDTPLPYYRFSYLLPKALELASEVKGLGALLLATLEKRDAEALAALRASHDGTIQGLLRETRQRSLDEAQANLLSLSKTRDVVHGRHQYYLTLPRVIPEETAHIERLAAAHGYSVAASVSELIATAAHLFPVLNFGSSGWAATPVVTAALGGLNVASAAQATSKVLSFLGSGESFRASSLGTRGGWARRNREWDHSRDQAQLELAQIDQQIEALKVRIEIAGRELKTQERQVEHAAEIEAALRDKFGNQELYGWMVGQLGSLYFQVYQLALEAAKRAERAWRFERGPRTASFVSPGAWDSLRRGLLAGERLSLDLRRMEAAYLQQNVREYELTKHVSLRQLDPYALIALKRTGSCHISLPEALFDLDHPGHMFRRIHRVAVSIPCITGPYTGVHATLTLHSSSIRVATAAAEPDPARQFVTDATAVDSIAISSAQNDTGSFELGFRDDRYFPFEGAGAVSEWQLDLPIAANAFDFDTITDVVMRVQYTARPGRDPVVAMAAAVMPVPARPVAAVTADARVRPAQANAMRLFSARHEFPEAWASFMRPVEGSEHQALRLMLDPSHFPAWTRGRRLTITRWAVLWAWERSAAGPGGAGPALGAWLAPPVASQDPAARQLSLASVPLLLRGAPYGEVAVTNIVSMGEWRLELRSADVAQLAPTLRRSEVVAGVERQRVRETAVEDAWLVVEYGASGG